MRSGITSAHQSALLRVATVGINAPNVVGTTVASVRDNCSRQPIRLHHQAGFPVALRGDAIITTRGTDSRRAPARPALC
jgi:hypothetical protein